MPWVFLDAKLASLKTFHSIVTDRARSLWEELLSASGPAHLLLQLTGTGERLLFSVYTLRYCRTETCGCG